MKETAGVGRRRRSSAAAVPCSPAHCCGESFPGIIAVALTGSGSNPRRFKTAQPAVEARWGSLTPCAGAGEHVVP